MGQWTVVYDIKPSNKWFWKKCFFFYKSEKEKILCVNRLRFDFWGFCWLVLVFFY